MRAAGSQPVRIVASAALAVFSIALSALEVHAAITHPPPIGGREWLLGFGTVGWTVYGIERRKQEQRPTATFAFVIAGIQVLAFCLRVLMPILTLYNSIGE